MIGYTNSTVNDGSKYRGRSSVGYNTCMECLFWYRCKLGGIDCEYRLR